MKNFLQNIVKLKKISTIKDFRFGLHILPTISGSGSGSGSGYTLYRPPSDNEDHSPNFFRQTSLLFHKWLAERFNLDDALIVNVRYKDTSI